MGTYKSIPQIKRSGEAPWNQNDRYHDISRL